MELTWKDVSSAETGFVVLRRDLPGASFHEIATVPAGTTRYLDSAVPNGLHVYAVATRGLFQGVVRTSPPSGRARVRLPSALPTITTDLPADLSNRISRLITFHVTVSDPDGDPVSLRLLNPQPGMIFRPIVDAPSPATVEVRWNRDEFAHLQETPVRLLFEANCGVRLVHDVIPPRELRSDSAVTVRDVTGDGKPDMIALAGYYPTPFLPRAYVFSGAATGGAPQATLFVPGEDLKGLQSDDLDGDGTLDLLMTGSSGVQFLRGGPGLAGTPAPTAVFAGCSGIRLVDLDGDGALDVVSVGLSVGGFDYGGLYVWYGSGGYLGSRAPDRILTAPTPAQNDFLGGEMLFCDVTGNGQLDIVAKVSQGIFIWDSAELAAGSTTPRATLTPGSSDSAPAMRVADLTGDGNLDVLWRNKMWIGGPGLTGVVPAHTTLVGQAGVTLRIEAIEDFNADGTLDALLTGDLNLNGHTRTGGYYLWAGGGPTGTVSPTATLISPDAQDFDLLDVFYAHIIDLDGDGVRDVLAGSVYLDGPEPDAGGLLVWYGGAGLVGEVAPARLGLVDTSQGRPLAFFGVHFADLDGDDALDVAMAAPFNGPGAIHVFSPGATRFAGYEVPSYTFTHSGSTTPSFVGLADVSGDGEDDLVINPDGNRLLVWHGGTGLASSTTPDAILTGPAQLGSYGTYLADLDEDSVMDLIAVTSDVDLAVADAGSIGIWYGGSRLQGTRVADITLSVAAAKPGDFLGNRGVRLADVNADGSLDLIAISPLADTSTSTDCGALQVWSGASLTTGPTPWVYPGLRGGAQMGMR